MPLDTRPDHLKIVEKILKKHVPVREVWAFGSRVNGTAKETSDLDLVVIGENPLDFQTLGALRDAFSESNLPYKVDVVDWATISETFREIIWKEKVVIQKEGSSVSLDLPLKKLPFGWKEDRLDTIADFNAEQVDSKYPHILIQYLDISGVSRGLVGNPELLALEEAPSRAKRIVRENDTIISTVRPGNRAYAFLKKVPNNLVVSTGFSVLRAKGCSPRFLYYLSTSDSIIDYLASIAEEKTAYPSVNPKDIAECRVFIPPVPEQRAIAHILGTLDDKIELNRRMNETLEAMAQAIFKSWFVDFDPVRAKMEGRPTGLPKEIEDLFPDSFEDSELGEIPKGWKVGELGDLIAQKVNRVNPNPETRSLPYVPIECITAKSIFLSQSLPGSEANSSLIKFEKGDILFGAMRPYFHKVCLAPFDGITRTTAFVLCSKKKEDQNFSLFSLFQEETIEFATNHSEGSTIPYAKWTDSLEKKEIVIPSSMLRNVFQLTVSYLIENGLVNIKEFGFLSEIRDELLPKLLSGEIRSAELTEG